MTQPTELSEMETIKQRSEQFYGLLVKLFSEDEAPKIARDILYNGKETTARIRELAMKTVYEKAEVQASFLDQPDPVRGALGYFVIAATETGDAVTEFKQLASLWDELCDFGYSRINMASLVNAEIQVLQYSDF